MLGVLKIKKKKLKKNGKGKGKFCHSPKISLSVWWHPVSRFSGSSFKCLNINQAFNKNSLHWKFQTSFNHCTDVSNVFSLVISSVLHPWECRQALLNTFFFFFLNLVLNNSFLKGRSMKALLMGRAVKWNVLIEASKKSGSD